MTSTYKRILVVRTDRLGDVILTLPVFSRLRACFPDAFIAALLRTYTGQIVEENSCVDELIWYDNEAGTPVPFLEMLVTLKKRQFDAAVVVYPRPRLAWLVYRAGIPVRVGTGYRFYSILFNRRVYEHRKDARKHEVEYNLDLLREVGCPPAGRVGRESFPIHISEAARNRVVAMLRESGVRMERRRIIIHPGSGGSAREWPLENFGRLGALLTEDEENEILVTGTESERARVDAVLHALAGRGKGFAGKTGVQELTALIESASLVIAHSTGPLHIAVACGTPVLGLYPQLTPMSPRRWGPYVGRNRVLVPDKPADCTDCAGGSFCPCMASISIGEAFEAAQALLSAAAVSTGSGS